TTTNNVVEETFTTGTDGKTGVGKSKTGNVILNNGNQFSCGSRGSSVTKICKTCDDIVSERWVTMVDTPGLFDTQKNNREVLNEITKCKMTAPGPHAFLFIFRIGRFKIEDKCTLDLFVKHFGENIFKFMVVIFTHYDDWKRDMENDSPTIHDFINTLPSQLQSIIQNKCNNRAVAFDNALKGLESRSQVAELISVIDIMNESNRKNGIEYYSNLDYEKAFIIRKKEILRRKHLRKMQRLEEETRVQNLIREAVDERVKNRLGMEQEKWKNK
ncbi:Hypothetical predicted protein, partial [Mytilus galloprovincialis]